MLLPFAAQAAPLPIPDFFDFAIEGPQTGASISYAGGANSLVGQGIIVTSVTAYYRDGTSAEKAIGGGILSFTTGAFTGFSSSAGVSQWTFDAGNSSIMLTGNVDGVTGNNLMWGDAVQGVVVKLLPGDNKIAVVNLTFQDNKNSELLGIFGFPEGNYEGNLNLSFRLKFTPSTTDDPLAFMSSPVNTGNIVNTPVPIPGAAWLLGAGLIGLVGIRRRMLP